MIIRSLITLVCLGFCSHQISAASDIGFDSNAIVAVKVTGQNDFCSGVVVGANEVLTATHCIYDLKSRTYYPSRMIAVGIGDNVENSNVQWFGVAEISSRPSATITTVSDFLGNDIVRITTANVLPVTPVSIAPDAPSRLPSDSPLMAWGFGEDEWGYYGIKKSRQLENPTHEGSLIFFSSGACRGDSGGPVLNSRNQIVGIISVSKVRHCVNAGQRIAQRIVKP